MGEYTKRHLLYFKASACGGSGLSVADQLGLIAGYEKLLAERDALAAELAKVKAGLPRWRKYNCKWVLEAGKRYFAEIEECGPRWTLYAGNTILDSRPDTREAAMLAVTETLGLPPCEVEGE